MRTTALAGATLAVIVLSACGSTPANPPPTSPSAASSVSTATTTPTSSPTASIEDYAHIVGISKADVLKGIASLHAACDPSAGADPECPLNVFTVGAGAQAVRDGLSGLPTVAGPPPPQIVGLVSDTVTAAGQVYADGVAFYHGQVAWAKVSTSVDTLASELAKWTPYGA